MTDTPRSQAELLTETFADGGPISAQDMRDFVVTAPVAAARFADAGNFTIYDTDQSPIKYSPTDAVDPEGWFTDEATYDGGFLSHAVPQGGLMRLPPGWYDFIINQAWSGISAPSGSDVAMIAAHVDDPATLDPIFGGNRYDSWGVGLMFTAPANTAYKNITMYSTLRVPGRDMNNDPVTTWPVCILMFANHFGSNVTGSFGSLLVRRIGAA